MIKQILLLDMDGETLNQEGYQIQPESSTYFCIKALMEDGKEKIIGTPSQHLELTMKNFLSILLNLPREIPLSQEQATMLKSRIDDLEREIRDSKKHKKIIATTSIVIATASVVGAGTVIYDVYTHQRKKSSYETDDASIEIKNYVPPAPDDDEFPFNPPVIGRDESVITGDDPEVTIGKSFNIIPEWGIIYHYKLKKGQYSFTLPPATSQMKVMKNRWGSWYKIFFYIYSNELPFRRLITFDSSPQPRSSEFEPREKKAWYRFPLDDLSIIPKFHYILQVPATGRFQIGTELGINLS